MRQTVERVKSGVLMKDILDCYPGIGTYAHTCSYYLFLFCSVLFWSLYFFILYLHSFLFSFILFVFLLYFWLLHFFFILLFVFIFIYLNSYNLPHCLSLFFHSILPQSAFFLTASFHQISSSFPLLFLYQLEEECLNLIIGGDVIACKNKALKSFVLFPRCVTVG